MLPASVNTMGTPAIYNPPPLAAGTPKTMYYTGLESPPVIWKHPILTDTASPLFTEDPTPTKITSVCSPAIIDAPAGGSIFVSSFPGKFNAYSLSEI